MAKTASKPGSSGVGVGVGVGVGATFGAANSTNIEKWVTFAVAL
ncbi:MAG: hypothetical protein QMD80_06555 [archaeon]|nr:hypothetical protein [archaeon]